MKDKEEIVEALQNLSKELGDRLMHKFGDLPNDQETQRAIVTFTSTYLEEKGFKITSPHKLTVARQGDKFTIHITPE